VSAAIEQRKNEYQNALSELFLRTEGNTLPESGDVDEACRGLKLFEAPLIGFGDASDPLFEEYKKPGVIGPWHKTPKEWMLSASTVISFFFPFTEEVRASNRAARETCSVQWVYGRIEGQQFQNAFVQNAVRFFEERGIRAMAPGLSEDFGVVRAGVVKGNPGYAGEIPPDAFGSNWSERHAAFVCGLGTFGLSKGLITEKGMAGRFSSILIAEKIPADKRAYTEVYEYCTKCGACARRCPLEAISVEEGKNHMICREYRERSLERYRPRFGCGLCQTGVPCECRKPKNAAGGAP